MICADFHTHTTASDGRTDIEGVVRSAMQKGLVEIAITDHGYGSTLCGMNDKKLAAQRKKICDINSRCDNFHVLSSIEANIVNRLGDLDLDEERIRQFDILVVGFHRFVKRRYQADGEFIFANGWGSKQHKEALVQVNTEAYIGAMRKYPIDVIAHLNHRALVDVRRVCDEACKRGVYIELNEKHIDSLQPFVQDIVDSGVNLIVGSDAHNAKRVGNMPKVMEFVQKFNLPKDRVFGIDGNLPTFAKRREE